MFQWFFENKNKVKMQMKTANSNANNNSTKNSNKKRSPNFANSRRARQQKCPFVLKILKYADDF